MNAQATREILQCSRALKQMSEGKEEETVTSVTTYDRHISTTDEIEQISHEVDSKNCNP